MILCCRCRACHLLPARRLSSSSTGGLLSSDGGILVLREVEQRLRVADRMAACLVDPRAPDQITHTLAAIMRFRLLMIAAGYEDGNDAEYAARRSDVQDGARSFAVGSRTVFATNDLALETCPMRAPCCAWAAPWWISIASHFTRLPGA